MLELLEVRTLNQYFQTNYRPEDLEEWPDADVQEAVKLAEEGFASEFGKLVAHLRDRLSGSEDGKPRIFRDSAVENLKEFFNRFRSLSVRSSPHLDDLVEQARQLVAGVAPQDLRDSEGLRQQIHGQLSSMQSAIDGLLVERPRRRILRGSSQEAT